MTPLEKLTGLTTLYLGGNQIADVTPLEKLTGLTTLYLDGNQIADVTVVDEIRRRGTRVYL